MPRSPAHRRACHWQAIQPGEVFAQNNAYPITLSVTADRTRVLLIDRRPRWEFRYLKNLLATRDSTVQLQYVLLESGGANLRYSEFKVSYAVAVGNIRCIALIGHNQCGMVRLIDRKEQFIRGLVDNAGWQAEEAEAHFDEFAPMFEIGNEIEFVLSEVNRLRLRYPRILIAPLLYRVEDNRLYLIQEPTAAAA